jgi:hypothetical protein
MKEGHCHYRERRNKNRGARGIALVTVLLLTTVMMLLGISIAGISTSQFRYSTKRNCEMIAKEAAIAGVCEMQFLLFKNDDWENLSTWFSSSNPDIEGAQGLVKVDPAAREIVRLFRETECYCSALLEDISDTSCTIRSTGYFKRGNLRLFEKTITMTLERPPKNFTVFAAASCKEFDITDNTKVEGSIATLQGTKGVCYGPPYNCNPPFSCSGIQGLHMPENHNIKMENVIAMGATPAVYLYYSSQLASALNGIDTIQSPVEPRQSSGIEEPSREAFPDIIMGGPTPPLALSANTTFDTVNPPSAADEITCTGSLIFNQVTVYGSIYATEDITIGGGCLINGPVCARGAITIVGATVTGRIFSLGTITIKESSHIDTGTESIIGVEGVQIVDSDVRGSIFSHNAIRIVEAPAVNCSYIYALNGLELINCPLVEGIIVAERGTLTIDRCPQVKGLIMAYDRIDIKRSGLKPSPAATGTGVVRRPTIVLWEELRQKGQ